MSMRVLVLDNFDSFTYNLVDFLRQLGCSVKVFRNTVSPQRLDAEAFDLLVLSPGPSVPRHAGNMMAVIERFYRTKPILGVCLGHQALIEFFGGTLANIAPVHGKSVPIQHDGRGIFTRIEQDVHIARYHSWAADQIPSELEVSARSQEGVVMAVRHKKLPIEGIQFHPESVLSMKNNAGMRMLRNAIEGRLSAGNQIYHTLVKKLQSRAALDMDTVRRFLVAVEEGQLSEDQKQILLVSFSLHLQNAPELRIFIDALMEFAQSRPEAFQGAAAEGVDICGTGGSGLPRINTSTLTALLLSHCGLKIAKHGNRAAAGRFGSFNLLESLGVPIRFDADVAQRTLTDVNLSFIFAPDVHPVFRHFAPVRAKIGVPTVFNILGPLVNPLLPKRQFIGTAFEDLMDVIFETGIRMGKEHLIVVRGDEGLDEISVSGPTRILEYTQGEARDYLLHPEDFGIQKVPFHAVSAPNPEACEAIARQLLVGHLEGEHYKLVAANAAFIYHKFVEPIPLPEAYKRMEALLRAGVLGDVVDRYKEVYEAEALPRSHK